MVRIEHEDAGTDRTSAWSGPLVVPATPAWLISPQLRRSGRGRGQRRALVAGVALLLVAAGSVAAGFGVHALTGGGSTEAGPEAVAAIGDTLYVSDPGHDQVRRLDAPKVAGATGAAGTVVAGNGHRGFSGDGGRAVDAELSDPGAVAVDAAGNLYIADRGNRRVRKVSPDGQISTVAGGGTGAVGAASRGNQVALSAPFSITVSGRGTLWIAEERRNRVSEVTTDGRIEVVAGTGRAGFAGDGKAAKLAMLRGPTAVAVDKGGQWLYVADAGNRRIRSVRIGTKTIQTFAGNGADGPLLTNRKAATVSLHGAAALAVGPDGTVYIGGEDLRKVSTAGVIAMAASQTTTSVAVTATGALFLVSPERNRDSDHRLYLLAANGRLSRLAW